MTHETLLPVELLRSGEWGDVAEVAGEPAWVCRMAELGVQAGCRFQVVQSGNPCLVQIRSGPRLCLRVDCAVQVLVRPLAKAG